MADSTRWLGRFVGVYHRPTKRVHLFERAARASRAKGGTRSVDYALDDPALAELIEPDLWEQTREEIELVEEVRPRAARQRCSTPSFLDCYRGAENLAVHTLIP